MQRGRFVVLVASLILSASALHSQASQPAITSLLGRCSTAMGTLDPGLGLRAQGTLTSTQYKQPQPLVIKTRGWSHIRTEVGNDVFVNNDGKGFAVQNGTRSDLSQLSTAFKNGIHLPSSICALASMKLNYLGTDQIAGKPVYVIQLTAPSTGNPDVDYANGLLSEVNIYLDASSFQILKLKRRMFSPDVLENYSDWEIYYTDYRQVNGILLPFRIEERVAGQVFQTTSLTSITVDNSISESDFQ